MPDGIENLYEAFRPYRLGTAIDGCDHCVSASMSRELLATPLRQLTAQQLSEYSLRAMTTWGTEDNFKHFLPRLLELAVIDPLEMDWLETLFGKLEMAKWQEWPASERRALENYLSYLWTVTLARPRRYDFDESAGSVLCAISRTGIAVEPFLKQWIQDDLQESLEHLCVFVHCNFEAMRKNKPRLADSFWDFGSPATTTVTSWLQSSEVAERIQRDQGRIEGDLADAVWQIELIANENPDVR